MGLLDLDKSGKEVKDTLLGIGKNLADCDITESDRYDEEPGPHQTWHDHKD